MIDITCEENLYITNYNKGYSCGISIPMKELTVDQLQMLITVFEKELRNRGNE